MLLLSLKLQLKPKICIPLKTKGFSGILKTELKFNQC